MTLTKNCISQFYSFTCNIKELPKKLMVQFECLGKTIDKCRNCSVPIEKEKKAYNKKSGNIIDKK